MFFPNLSIFGTVFFDYSTMDQFDDKTYDIHNVLTTLQKSESIGESILNDRTEIINLDRIRQKNREALTAIKNHYNHGDDDGQNIYICMGNMFIKHPIKRARSLIQRDQNIVNEQIEILHKNVKNNVEKIQELEGKSEQFRTFNLKPLNSSEMKSFNVVLDSIKKLDL
ncbi:pdrg1 prefoldin-like subunit [Dermatophagoides pteronyssinus]|uniref:pdrg1 prefoldin-like subunit n=1 Tax=Dermatophagoides pteronyssinus TaxID=6956 RepID=UPI003F676A6B